MSHDPHTLLEFLNTMCGGLIGDGMTRQVFSLPLSPEYVVKIEQNQQSHHQNVTEWITWQAVQYTKWAKWFAPCKIISPDGKVLVMARTEQIDKYKYPDRMPVFLSDFKIQNYGRYRGKFVCHDYGSNILMSNGLSDRLRKVKWYE